MRRIAAVVVVAALLAAISRLDEISVTRAQTQPGIVQHRQRIAERLGPIAIGSPIEVDPVQGEKFQGLLVGVTPDSVNVMIIDEHYSLLQTIPFESIRNVKRINKIGGAGKTRTVLIYTGIAVGAVALLGACSAAVSDAQGN